MEQQDVQKPNKLVPVEQVLDDMYSDGYAQSAARDYYYQHYATTEEQAMMRREDKIADRCCALFWLGYIGLIVTAIILGCMR